MIRSHFDLIGFDGENPALFARRGLRLWKYTAAPRGDVQRLGEWLDICAIAHNKFAKGVNEP
jgi:hypothetical protein